MGNCWFCSCCLHVIDDIPVFSMESYHGWLRITDIYDGDTFKGILFHHCRPQKFTFRTLDYDAPEMKPLKSNPNRNKEKKQAIAAKELFQKLSRWETNLVYVQCYKMDKYGRVLARVYQDYNAFLHDDSINKKMIESSLVNRYDGKKKKEFNFD